MKKVLLILAALTLLAPVAVWAMYKLVRVIAPEWVENISCVTPKVCVDDESKYPEASRLYDSALQFVASTVGPFQETPRAIFCATEACFQSFGFNKASAAAVGRSGIIISPMGWQAYYLRHEMIHYRQAEELGILAPLLDPEWFIEGMTYSLSSDPRQQLADPWQGHRAKFDAWYKKVKKDHLWEEARKL